MSTDVEIGRELRDRLDESSPLALHITTRDVRDSVARTCRCGQTLDDPTSELCGPCGRDRGAR